MSDSIRKTITVFAENFQFHLQDKRTECDYPESWNEEIMNGLFVSGSNVIGVGTVRDLDVDINLEIFDKPMDEKQKDQLPDLADWDHAVQCTLDVPSGQLLIAGPAEDIDEATIITVKPGRYGVRIFWANLEDIDEIGFEGEDSYCISMWPDTELETKILKRWRSLIYYDGSALE